jgi:hypothetical protein
MSDLACPVDAGRTVQHCRGENCGWLVCAGGVHIIRASDGHVSGHPTPEAPQ